MKYSKVAESLSSDAPTPRDHGWIEYLKSKIDEDWRPGEFDYDGLIFAPNADNRDNHLSTCQRESCQTCISGSLKFCSSCRQDRARSGTSLSMEEWAAQAGPRWRPTYNYDCCVPGCPRSHSQLGLCSAHCQRYRYWLRSNSGGEVPTWISKCHPTPLPPAPDQCAIEHCTQDAVTHSLCKSHWSSFLAWSRRFDRDPERSVQLWLTEYAEPLYDEGRSTYAEKVVTAFGLLVRPLAWELLYAVQQREREGRMLHPLYLRAVYLKHRHAQTASLVGATMLGVDRPCKQRRGVYRQWQEHIDAAYREWSGVDDRDPRIIWIRELAVAHSSKPIGPDAKIDLRPIEQDWIADGVRAWVTESPREYTNIVRMTATWANAARTMAVRGTPILALGAHDMDAIVKALSKRWTSIEGHARAIFMIRTLLVFTRNRDQFADTWGAIPARFSIDPARHPASGFNNTRDNGDEPFRFVPQPIIEHLMNNLHLLRKVDSYTGIFDAYLTAEARALVYVHERCGRRPGETIKLRDDCISYDDSGKPYLEWVRGKPPYTQGKRLPIHQETHDVIRQWQDIKREHNVASKWLFPKRDTNSRVDKHWSAGYYLGSRVRELISTVESTAPFDAPVEGAEGNLIHFDLSSIDPYSFRHAFAQRYADATDDGGHPTTPPDVLQDLMGHAHFSTTMLYYEVSVKRRRKVIEAIPARRLNLHGDVVIVDRERDGFTKVSVTLGHCTEPQNVAQHGHGCMIEHACESCPFFLVDPLERDAMNARRQALKVHLERARAITARQHILDHYNARIKDCTIIIDAIDTYIEELPPNERKVIRSALDSMEEVRRLAVSPRAIDLRAPFVEENAR